MVKNNIYFYLGGFISLTLFMFFVSLFLYMMFAPSKVKTFALKKDTYISISITMPTLEMKKDTKNIKSEKLKDVSTQSSVPKIKKTVPKNLNVEDLFNDVWTKKITIKKEKPKPKRVEKKLINPKVLKEIEKKIKTLDLNDKKSISENIEKIEKSVKNKKESSSSNATEINEYLAKINALVYRYFNPPQNTQGHSVKAVIELTAFGKVTDFRILSYSANDTLNKECDKIRERLVRIVFPLNPKNKSSTTIVILTSKE